MFENLLPDRDSVRRRVAERMGAQAADFYSLLEAIGRDCVGAMQFLPQGEGGTSAEAGKPYVKGEPVSDAEMLDRTPEAIAKARVEMPDDFATAVHESIAHAIDKRLPRLASALQDL